ncbi:unnamed protein product, partial [Coregonus sp. 'balchen']
DHCLKESECVTERRAHFRKLGEQQESIIYPKTPAKSLIMKELKLHCGQDIHQTLGCFAEKQHSILTIVTLIPGNLQYIKGKCSLLPMSTNTNALAFPSPIPMNQRNCHFTTFPLTLADSLQALSSSCSHSPLSLSSTSAVNATGPQQFYQSAVNTGNNDCSSLLGVAQDTPVPYQGGSSV